MVKSHKKTLKNKTKALCYFSNEPVEQNCFTIINWSFIENVSIWGKTTENEWTKPLI